MPCPSLVSCPPQVRDLLSKDPKARLELHEAKDGGVYVKGLNTFVVKSEAEIAAVLEVGGNGWALLLVDRRGLKAVMLVLTCMSQILAARRCPHCTVH